MHWGKSATEFDRPITESRSPVILKSGAWFIADAHASPQRTELVDNLEKALQNNTLPPQLFLMGDIFDMLYGDVPATVEANRHLIETIERVAKRCEVYYLEGNHDFNLSEIFGSDIRLYPRERQPLFATLHNETVALHHGDIRIGLGYEVYTFLIRSRAIVRFLRKIDTFSAGKIVDWLIAFHEKKRPCYKIEDFHAKIHNRLMKLMRRYPFRWWIEGHFHQDVTLKMNERVYVNLPSFACGGNIGILKNVVDGVVSEKMRKKVT